MRISICISVCCSFFFSSRRRHTRCALVTGVQTCALPISVGVRLSTPKRGCSGLAYSVDYVADASPMDERIETPGGILFVDSGSLLYLIGSTMDWREDDFTTGFVFDNPNATGLCGCGESLDRKRVGEGKSGSVRVDIGRGRLLQKKKID